MGIYVSCKEWMNDFVAFVRNKDSLQDEDFVIC